MRVHLLTDARLKKGLTACLVTSCPGYSSGDSTSVSPGLSSVMVDKATEAAVVGGVDTHKDLHVAAVVDQNNKVLGTQYFSTTRQGYRDAAWMTSFRH